jgi:DNA helicase-2/ATP-dependent DNA helicase PcrA
MIDEIPEYLLNASLNKEQLEAINCLFGPIVVCAGAGSGKTRVIAYRTLNLIKKLNCDPKSITCVTFTNKAAKEMRERIESLLDDKDNLPIVTTFHGYSLKLIRQYGAYLGISNFTIIDESDQKTILQKILEDRVNSKDITLKKVSSYINAQKSGNFNDFLFLSNKDKLIYDEIYKLYEDYKKESHCFDFDDLLFYALKLLKIDAVLNKIINETRHILVDEYQDTNFVQHEMIKRISTEDKILKIDSICVVGDEDQSIYSWRGANVSNITDFKNDFIGTRIITLTRNYRSTQPILNLANSVIEKNEVRNPKNLWTDKNSSKNVVLMQFSNGYQEAEIVIKTIKSLKSIGTIGTCAILYRSHYQSRLFEEMCVSNSVNYKIFGNINFYDRMEIKDILAYIKLYVNKFDRVSFSRCSNTPNRGFGESSLKDFMQFWILNNELEIENCIINYLSVTKLTERIRSALNKVLEILQNIDLLKDSPSEVIKYVISKSEYYSYLERTEEDQNLLKERKENILELIDAARNFESQNNGNVFNFIDHVTLMDDKDKESIVDKSQMPVLLMSIHAAKGLEFSTVFIVGLEDGIFPGIKVNINREGLEEERRLLYVAITRARESLFCTYAVQRALWGTIRLQERSSFLKDFSNDVIFLNMASIPFYIFESKIKEGDLSYLKDFSKSYSDNNFSKNNFKIRDDVKIGYENKVKLTPKVSQINSRFKISQTVKHEFFGVGKVVSIDNDYCAVLFSDGLKKIKSDFLK